MIHTFVEDAGRSCRATLMTVAALLSCMTGCQLHLNTWDGDSIPANRLDPDLFSCSREGLMPIPQTRLGQVPPQEHLVGSGDVLSVYIYGVFPPVEDDTPVIQQQQGLNQRYYPPHGSVVAPATGLPIKVEEGGILDLPLIDPLVVEGLSMPRVVEAIRSAYYQNNVILEGQGRITVSLLIPRTKRVVVLREDAPSPQMVLTNAGAVEQTHRGSGEVVDLPIYQNDVLHALTATGGLPGSDGSREVYVIRAAGGFTERFLKSSDPNSLVSDYVTAPVHDTMSVVSDSNPSIIRIPLMLGDCNAIPFTPFDVLLNEGDVLFVPRRREYFYTGGLLPGGRVPLPRDEDLDIVEAISMIGASPGGPMGNDGSTLAVGRHTYLRAATRAVILRRLPDGRQLNIRVDLDRAMHDPKERIRIQSDDVVMLYQKPLGAVLNAALNVGVR